MKVRVNVWTEVGGEVALSGWRIALLEGVARTGSISGAAQAQGVHFRVAWRKIREMEQRLGERLVVGHAGGQGGGGAVLTPAAERLVGQFRALLAGLEEEVQARFDRCFPETAGEVPGRVMDSRPEPGDGER